MAFENFFGILIGHFFFFFITQSEKGLVCVSQLPVVARRRLAIDSVPTLGERKVSKQLRLGSGPREGVPR